MTKVKCSFCNKEFLIDGRFDDDMNGITECPNCNVRMGTIFFEFIEFLAPEEEDNAK